MNRRTFINAGLVLPTLPLSGCSIFSKSYRYRFRIKLYSIIDGIERVDGSVVEGHWVDTMGFSPVGRWQSHFWGDAIVTKRGAEALIALLGTIIGHSETSGDSSDGFQISLRLFAALSGQSRPNISLLDAVPHFLNQERDVPRDFWPIIIYLPDINRIETIRYENIDGFEKGFSAGSKVSRVTIHLTDDPVTDDIGAKLPWLNQVGTFRNIPIRRRDTLPVYQQLDRNNFRAEGGAL
jgi:hypothetical protein